MITSISLEKERYKALPPVIASRLRKVVALCLDRTAMPTTIQEHIIMSAGNTTMQ